MMWVDANPNEEAVVGRKYRAFVTFDGLGTLMPGWRADAVNQLRQEMPNAYIDNIYPNGGNTIVMEYHYTSVSGMEAKFAPIAMAAVIAICVAISVVGIVYLSYRIDAFQAVLPSFNPDDPQFFLTVAIVGVVGIFALAYLVRGMRKGKHEEYKEIIHKYGDQETLDDLYTDED